MKLVIAYDSKTGNTKRLAEGLAGGLMNHPDVSSIDAMAISGDEPLPASPALDAADAVLAGFWTDKGTCSETAAAFLGRLVGKRVFLFGTAGFGESAEYFDRILGNVRARLPEDAEYLGGAMCQGKMGEAVKARYEAQLAQNPDDERAKLMLATYEKALGHPDDEDVAGILAAAVQALGL